MRLLLLAAPLPLPPLLPPRLLPQLKLPSMLAASGPAVPASLPLLLLDSLLQGPAVSEQRRKSATRRTDTKASTTLREGRGRRVREERYGTNRRECRASLAVTVLRRHN